MENFHSWSRLEGPLESYHYQWLYRAATYPRQNVYCSSNCVDTAYSSGMHGSTLTVHLTNSDGIFHYHNQHWLFSSSSNNCVADPVDRIPCKTATIAVGLYVIVVNIYRPRVYCPYTISAATLQNKQRFYLRFPRTVSSFQWYIWSNHNPLFFRFLWLKHTCHFVPLF